MNIQIAVEAHSNDAKDKSAFKKIVEKIKEIIKKTIKFIKDVGPAFIEGCIAGIGVGGTISSCLPPDVGLIVISTCAVGGGIVGVVRYVVEHHNEPNNEEPHQESEKNIYAPIHGAIDVKEGGVSIEDDIDADAIFQQYASQKENPQFETQVSLGLRM